MGNSLPEWLRLLLAGALACVLAWLFTPSVRRYALRLGVLDRPGARRVNDRPVPRMGGLAIFLSFTLTVLLSGEYSTKVCGLLLGGTVIALMGALDDIFELSAWAKLGFQILAALLAIRFGNVILVLSDPLRLNENAFYEIRGFAWPLTLLWFVGCTNALNLIDGLDGLAVGVSAIGSVSMLAVAVVLREDRAALLLAALAGACLGFIPYNLHPAKIFMGDVGSQFLGFLLAGISVLGMFKYHAAISFLAPVLVLSVPLFDTVFAFCRRIRSGRSPFMADKGHIHHRLLALGLSQEQAVAVLYAVSAVMGLLAVVLTGNSQLLRVLWLIISFLLSLLLWQLMQRGHRQK